MSINSPNVLHSSVNPMPSRASSFFDKFSELTLQSDYILMTTGYISESSLFFLKMNLENLPKFNLVVGMSGIEGFTKSQYHGLVELNEQMISQDKGMSYVSTAFKYHGKAYSFFKDSKPFASIVGSTNLSILGEPNKRQYELDVMLSDPESLKVIVETQNDLIGFSKSVAEFEPKKFIVAETKPLLEVFADSPRVVVEKVAPQSLSDILKSMNNNSEFKLKLKCEQKSNMNVAFGGGRGGGVSGRGRLTPRSWLEFEVIVSTEIYRKAGYPAGISFWVVTDDGWSFICSTQGGQRDDLLAPIEN